MSIYEPLRVTAHLAGGIAQASPWGIALDGLLASALWADHKDTQRAAGVPTTPLHDVEDPTDLPLPLARCTRAGADLWHWAATCAHPAGPTCTDVRTWTGRVDHRGTAQLTADLPKVVADRQGRYRARRMPLLVTACAAVTWHAIGDPIAVTELVSTITAIGKKRSHGEGHVLRWDVDTLDWNPWAAAHLHPDGTLGRPTPAGCLEHPDNSTTTGIVDGGLGTAGLRPPYMHRARQHSLHLPALLDG